MLPLVLLLAADWTRFGGPHGDFQLSAEEAPLSWPAAGPRRLWDRELGDGYSSVLAAGPRLYTMYRRGGREFVIALDAATGATIWEFGYDAPLPANFDHGIGDGPRATPLLLEGRLFTAGATGKFHCLDARNGEVRWAKDAVRDFGGSVRASGYSPSPLAWRDTVIFFPGGPGAAIAALRQADGSVAWQGHDDVVSYASPRLAAFAGRDLLLTAFSGRIAGLDPATGEALWSYPHQNDQQVNAMLPIWHPSGILFYSSGYSGNSAAAAITESAGKFSVRELWSHKRARVHFSNAVLLGETVYVASGDLGPAPFAALDLRTGALRWRDRSLPRAAPVAAGAKLLLLDEDGVLALASPGDAGLRIEGKLPVLTNPAWTPPTVAGKRIYVRDRRRIAALELD